MKRLFVLLASCCLLAGSARADQFVIQFDFSGSSLSMLGGIIQIPPDGSITSGSAELVVSALGLATPMPSGYVALRNFAASATTTTRVGLLVLAATSRNKDADRQEPFPPVRASRPMRDA